MKKGARFLLHKAGMLRGVRLWRRNQFRILMYHNFSSADPQARQALDRQCAHMKRHYAVVSLTEIGRSLRGDARLPQHALAITVDDGYRDFLLNGAPVFREHGLPVTVYLVSGFLDGKMWFWWDQVAYALDASKRTTLTLALFPGKPLSTFPIETQAQRKTARVLIVEELKKMEASDRQHFIDVELTRGLEVDVPPHPPECAAPLLWSDVRMLQDQGVEFGAHTVTHPIMSHIRNPDSLSQEIADSKKRIEQETGRPVIHFCYPFGLSGDFNEESVTAVRKEGFLTATTAEFGMNDAQSHSMKLLRLAAEPATPFEYFTEIVAGAHAL